MILFALIKLDAMQHPDSNKNCILLISWLWVPVHLGPLVLCFLWVHMTLGKLLYVICCLFILSPKSIKHTTISKILFFQGHDETKVAENARRVTKHICFQDPTSDFQRSCSSPVETIYVHGYKIQVYSKI